MTSLPRLLKSLQPLDPQITFQAYSTLYNDTGLFGMLFTSFAPEMIPQIVHALLQELENIADNINDGKTDSHF